MKCKYLFLLSAAILVSCGMDHDAINEQIYRESVKNNAEQKLGVTVDPNHTWSSVTKSTINITADAPLIDIQKVRILTESPFFNDNAEFLAEAEVTKGQTITLNFDIPKHLDRLIAACVDSKGNYYIKGFNPGEKSVSFAKPFRARTRGAAGVPDLSGVRLDAENSIESYNAKRTKSNTGSWKDSGWENDRLWLPTGTVNGWTMNESTIYTDADAITEEERQELVDIFSSCLYRDDKKGYNGRRDNLTLIREGNAVKFFNNHLVTDGKNPITLIPVQLASTDAAICDIYYYYFKPEDVTSSGLSEADYIKTLPKFKAIDLSVERSAFSAQTGIGTTVRDENFLRVHEYLLPYYGEASEYEPVTQMLSQQGYTTDGKFYRIHNASEGKNNYFTYGGSGENLKDAYTENVEHQLWQVFTNDNDPNDVKVMLYNVYAKQFMFYQNGGENKTISLKDIDTKDLTKFNFRICDPNGKQTDSRTNIYIFATTSNCLKSVSGICLGNGGTKNTGSFLQTRLWSFEEYTGSSAVAINDFQLPAKYFPTSVSTNHSTASAIFGQGYKIGFLIRKELANNSGGCLYGYGELNRQINTYGQFKSAIEHFSMELNDPRIAMFNANGKTYLCFEEGSDTQYSDVIVELGGTATSKIKKQDASGLIENVEEYLESNTDKGCGFYYFDAEPEVIGTAYTLCFEDRPREADFDMNDVVIQARIIDSNTVQVILVACGAQDRLLLQIPGSKLFNNTEVHNLFGLYGDQYFVNTVVGGLEKSYGIYENISTGLGLEEFLQTISIKNLDLNETIGFQKQGEYPQAIIVPSPFDYPQEKASIMEAYPDFLDWVENMNKSGDWYTLNREANKIFPNLFRKK